MGNVSLGKVYEVLMKIEKSMITRDEMNQFVETIEISSNPEVMQQIFDSEQDIKAGRVRKINSVRDI